MFETAILNRNIPSNIDKIICFGLTSRLTETRHIAVLEMRNTLQEALGHPVRLLAEDYDYTSEERDILER